VSLSILLAGDYPADPTLGSSKVFYKLQEEFVALGHRCDILFADEIRGPRSRQLRQAVTPWYAGQAIIRRAERTPYDVVDVASAEGLWIGLFNRMRARSATPYVCRSNGLEQLNYRRMLDDARAGLTAKPWTRRIWYPLSRLSQVEWAARLAHRLLLLNAHDHAFALNEGWQPPDRIDVVAHGVSSRYLTDRPPAPLPRGQGLLFCGSWDHMKGIAYLVAAVERLHAKGRRLPLTVLGPGVPEATVMAAFSPSVRASIRVIARVPEDEVIRLYRAHDVLLWTSTYEGFGLVLLEAMSQELAVVTTPVGCAPALVRDGENGLLVPPRDPEAIVAAVERLMDDTALRLGLGGAAARSVAGMTWRATAEKTIDLYQRTISSSGASR
jgi:glycosyltransferase involved in cell wall biosynthesis